MFVFLLVLLLKKAFPLKYILVWTILFCLGVINVSSREYDNNVDNIVSSTIMKEIGIISEMSAEKLLIGFQKYNPTNFIMLFILFI